MTEKEPELVSIDMQEGECEPVTPGQRERVLLALDEIERAQRLLADAAEKLCPIPYLGPEWDKVRALYFQVRDCWHAIDDKLPFLSAKP
jgi:hypothetical protein